MIIIKVTWKDKEEAQALNIHHPKNGLQWPRGPVLSARGKKVIYYYYYKQKK
jgi:hypothetical protein